MARSTKSLLPVWDVIALAFLLSVMCAVIGFGMAITIIQTLPDARGPSWFDESGTKVACPLRTVNWKVTTGTGGEEV
ncbi:hypothetical protein F4780DRAFT_765482 [Xylariomycetidae sp. FL0641]|nr:hypothetical protein F4780DRAFT_765482 [Xylariomycetidae sp. FL0641]